MSYSSKGLPWSSGIGTDVSDCSTSKEVMEKVGLDWFVDKCEVVAKMPFSIKGFNEFDDEEAFMHDGNIYRDLPNTYATYRTDHNIPLGLVKQKYEVIQNIEAFNFFDEAIGEGKAIWDYAGCFGLGHKVFISAKLPIETTVKGDKIDNYLVFSNSHDGSSSVNILFTPIRVICTNCLNAAFKNADSYIRIKHTRRARERIHQGAEILKVACEYAKNSQELYESLTKISMSDDVVKRYFAKLVLSDAELQALDQYDAKLGIDKLLYRDYLTMENTNISTRKANKLASIWMYYLEGIGQRHILGTAWGAYNAITGYYSNIDNKEGEARMDSLLYGGAANVMSTALNSVVEIKAA